MGKERAGFGRCRFHQLNKETVHPVISLMEKMRLGKHAVDVEPGSKLFAAYGERHISERHRHRHCLSNSYREEMIKSGLIIGAISPDKDLVECVEWPDHPWGLGVQFHPEFKSKPTAVCPLFRDFIMAARDKKAAGN